MRSKNINDKNKVPSNVGPVPVGTPLHRALEVVAKSVAEELAKLQGEKPSQPDEIPGDADRPPG